MSSCLDLLTHVSLQVPKRKSFDSMSGGGGNNSPSYVSRKKDSSGGGPGGTSKDYYSYNYANRAAADDSCSSVSCVDKSKRVEMSKYCAMDYVYLITVIGKDRTSADDTWTRFRIEVDKRYKGAKGMKLRRGQLTYLWVRTKNLRCRCPKIRPNKSYLVLDNTSYDDHSPEDSMRPPAAGLPVKRKTMIIEWKKEWRRRMKRFKKRAQKVCKGGRN